MKSVWAIVIIFFGLLTAANFACAQMWMQSSAPTNINWSAVASSADGSKLAAVSGSGNTIYTSADSGTTWWPVIHYPIGSWMSIASSADGAKLAVAGFNSPICVSTNFGVCWTVTESLRQGWFAIAASTDGTKLLAAALIDATGKPGGVFTSTDSGNTWTQTDLPNASWRSVASSADGTKLMAACQSDANGNLCPLFISTNAGVSWESNNIPVAMWESVGCSSDGSKIVAGDFYGAIYTSTNLGAMWISSNSGNPISSVASSSDGSVMIACEEGGAIYGSTNYGEVWTPANAPFENWTGVAISADGSKSAGVVFPGYDGGIFVSDGVPSPRLNFSSFNRNLNFSWLVPSTNMVLQESLDLMNWEIVSNAPSLNLTNLEEQVALSQGSSNGFYRLVSQ